MDKLILCTSAEEAIFLTKSLNFKNIENTIIIAFNSEIESILDHAGLTFKNYSEYLGLKVSEKIYKRAIQLSQLFINDDYLKSVLIFNQVSYLEAIESDLPVFFLKILKDVEIILSLIKIEKPSKIFSIFPDSEFIDFEPKDDKSYLNEIAKLVCAEFKIQYKLIFDLRQKTYEEKNFIQSSISNLCKLIRKIENYKILKEKKKISVLAYQPDYFSNIYSKIKDNSAFEITYLDASKNHPNPLSNGLLSKIYSVFLQKYNSLTSFSSYSFNDEYKNEKYGLFEIRDEYIRLNNNKKEMSYGGINIFPVFQTFLSKLFGNIFPKITFNILCFKNVVKTNKLSHFITWSDCIFLNRSLVLFCNKNQITTNVIQHGAFLFPLDFLPCKANNFFAWGNLTRNSLIENGTDPNKIKVVGWSQLNSKEIKNSKPKFGKKMVNLVFATQYTKPFLYNKIYNYNFYLVNKLCQIASINKKLELVIKLHPQDFKNKKRYINLVNSNFKGASIRIVSDGRNLNSYIAESDIFIFQDSTSGLEGMLQNKKLIYLELNDSLFTIPYSSSNVEIVDNLNNLDSAIKELILKPNIIDEINNEFIDDFCSEAGDKSADLIIKELLEK